MMCDQTNLPPPRIGTWFSCWATKRVRSASSCWSTLKSATSPTMQILKRASRPASSLMCYIAGSNQSSAPTTISCHISIRALHSWDYKSCKTMPHGQFTTFWPRKELRLLAKLPRWHVYEISWTKHNARTSTRFCNRWNKSPRCCVRSVKLKLPTAIIVRAIHRIHCNSVLWPWSWSTPHEHWSVQRAIKRHWYWVMKKTTTSIGSLNQICVPLATHCWRTCLFRTSCETYRRVDDNGWCLLRLRSEAAVDYSNKNNNKCGVWL